MSLGFRQCAASSGAPGSAEFSSRPAMRPNPYVNNVSHAPRTSQLMREVCKSAMTCAGTGTVPRDYMISTDNQVPHMLSGVDAIFKAMRDLIATARHEVLLQAFAWQDSSMGASLLRSGLQRLNLAQLDRVRRGESTGAVRVDLFVRRSGLRFLSKRDTSQLERLIGRLDPALVKVRLWDHREMGLGLLHSKSIVADGYSAVVCGANPERHSNPNRSWYDSGCILRGGGVVRALRGDLVDLWADCRLRRANYASPAPPSHVSPCVGTHPNSNGISMLVVSRRRRNSMFNTDLRTPQAQAVLTSLNYAHDHIRMMTPNLNAKSVVNALAHAAQRGVQVELLLPHRFDRFTNSRLTLQGGGNEHNVRKLYRKLAHHPHARERLHVRWFSHDGKTPVVGNGPFSSHAKGLSVDDQVTCVSSFNYDMQSFFRSREIGVFMDNPAVAQMWHAQIFGPQFARAIKDKPRKLPRRTRLHES